MQATTTQLLAQFKSGDKRALARLMTYVENRHDDLLALMAQLTATCLPRQKIGITGPPGAGKSTLVDKLIRSFRAQNKTVGIVAMDPSSPFTGGAVLGDRIRMQEHSSDAGVFIRSVGSRGAHGGLARSTRDMVRLMEAFGFDVILIETVGVGQTELDIMDVADTTLVVLVPESGDTVQTMKAGLMEIADIFVVNKADREGADKIFHELAALAHMYAADWEVPVLQTVATKNQGVAELLQAIERHGEHLRGNPAVTSGPSPLFVKNCVDIICGELAGPLAREIEKSKSQNPYEAAKSVLQKIRLP